MYYKVYTFVLVLLGVAGFFSFGRANVAPVGAAFDLLVILSLVLRKARYQGWQYILFFFFAFYFIFSLLYSQFFMSSHFLDFLLSYKVVVYLAIIVLAYRKTLGDESGFLFLYWFLTVFIFLKYFVSVSFDLNSRPLLYRENNFELMFFVLVFYLKFIIYRRIGVLEWVLVASIFTLSMSKSAIPVFLFVSLVIFFESVDIKKLFYMVPLLLFVGVVFFVVFYEVVSSVGLEGIDRVAFLRVYVSEAMAAPWYNFILGMERVSPLSSQSCSALYHYPGLFSYNNDGTCYSVILHSFVLRSLFDHGLLGTLIIVYVTYYLLRRSGYSIKSSVVVNVVLLLNGLSVSSYNSYFYPMSMILFLGYYRSINSLVFSGKSAYENN